MTDDGGGSAATNPFLNNCATLSSPAFSANPTLGGVSTYTQTWRTITTNNCDKGIFQAWLRGESSAPYTARVHETLVNINVGGQARDFSLGSSDAFDSVASPGTQADYVIRTTTASSGSTKWTGSNLLTLSWAKCPTTTSQSILPPEVLVCGIDGNFASGPITNVDPGSVGYHNYQDWLANTQLEQRVSLEDYSVSNRGLRAALIGTPEQVAERVRAFSDAGVGLLLLQCSPQLEEMERFSEQVMPLV